MSDRINPNTDPVGYAKMMREKRLKSSASVSNPLTTAQAREQMRRNGAAEILTPWFLRKK